MSGSGDHWKPPPPPAASKDQLEPEERASLLSAQAAMMQQQQQQLAMQGMGAYADANSASWITDPSQQQYMSMGQASLPFPPTLDQAAYFNAALSYQQQQQQQGFSPEHMMMQMHGMMPFHPEYAAQLQLQQQQSQLLLQQQLMMQKAMFQNQPESNPLAASEAAFADMRKPGGLPTTMREAARIKDKKKNKDKPKRPLSAYNLFFKDERAKMLEAGANKTEGDPEGGAGEEEVGRDNKVASDSSADAPDPDSTKRKRKPHGVVGFEDMARAIAAKWRNIDPDLKSKYEAEAAKEKDRYLEEKKVYNKKQQEGLEASLNRLEATVAEETRAKYLASRGSTGSSSKADKK